LQWNFIASFDIIFTPYPVWLDFPPAAAAFAACSSPPQCDPREAFLFHMKKKAPAISSTSKFF